MTGREGRIERWREERKKGHRWNRSMFAFDVAQRQSNAGLDVAVEQFQDHRNTRVGKKYFINAFNVGDIG